MLAGRGPTFFTNPEPPSCAGVSTNPWSFWRKKVLGHCNSTVPKGLGLNKIGAKGQTLTFLELENCSCVVSSLPAFGKENMGQHGAWKVWVSPASGSRRDWTTPAFRWSFLDNPQCSESGNPIEEPTLSEKNRLSC